MKLHDRYTSIEPVTSVIDAIEDSAQESFPLHAGDKIAYLNRTSPFYRVVLEMEMDGRAVVNWSERVAIVVEGNNIANLGNHLYKIDGYNHDVVDECMYQKMRGLVAHGTGKWNDTLGIDAILAVMIENGIVAINGD